MKRGKRLYLLAAVSSAMAVWSCYMGVVEDWLSKIPDKQVYITDAPN